MTKGGTTASNLNSDDGRKPLTLLRSSYADFVQRINDDNKMHAIINEFGSGTESSDLPTLNFDEEITLRHLPWLSLYC